jgi:L-alanine-DL-glutamate epimerase-like enolase superfamily enzyme
MLWASTDPDRVRETAHEITKRGYDAQKWFFPHGPGSGRQGMQRNLDLVEAAREAVGEEYDLMFDAWMSWDRTYATEMIDRLETHSPTWLEEPVGPDALSALSDLTATAPFPIAGGEHEYTRWGFSNLLERDALDIVQPDPLWAGGVSEFNKICTLATTHDVPVFPHGLSLHVCVHVSAAQPPSVTPRVEYLVRPNEALQHFVSDPLAPEKGTVEVPEHSGLGLDIDRSAVETRSVLESP